MNLVPAVLEDFQEQDFGPMASLPGHVPVALYLEDLIYEALTA